MANRTRVSLGQNGDSYFPTKDYLLLPVSVSPKLTSCIRPPCERLVVVVVNPNAGKKLFRCGITPQLAVVSQTEQTF